MFHGPFSLGNNAKVGDMMDGASWCALIGMHHLLKEKKHVLNEYHYAYHPDIMDRRDMSPILCETLLSLTTKSKSAP